MFSLAKRTFLENLEEILRTDIDGNRILCIITCVTRTNETQNKEMNDENCNQQNEEYCREV